MNNIRHMQNSDLDAVMAIESESAFCWKRESVEDCLKYKSYSAFVLESDDFTPGIIGYCVALQTLSDAHLLKICTRQDCQRKGYASQMLEYLVQSTQAEGAVQILLEVRVSNCAAIALYQRYGFEQIACRKNYYPAKAGREDALVMRYIF